MGDLLRSVIEENMGISLSNVSDALIISLSVVAVLLAIVSIISLFVQIYLAIKYIKYNRKQNSCGMTGQEVARKILDANSLENIKVKSSGSILFGNSYSHFFKKVRLRRLTWKKKSISSLAMASQKSCLAILDKENDPDMKTRIKLTPITYFGPLFCLPLIIIGVLIDILILKSETPVFTLICTSSSILLYVVAFIMSIKILKTEIKAQNKAYEVLKENNMATDEELDMLKKLFKLYNIEYVNNMIVALLELVYRVLQLFMYFQQNSSNSNNN